MRLLLAIVAAALLCAPGALRVLAAQPPAAATVAARLETAVSSDTARAGDRVEAVALGLTGEAALVPPGCRLRGRVALAASRQHEPDRRAELALAFDRVADRTGREYPLALTVAGVDNAREEVTADGRILGLPPVRVRPTTAQTLLMLAAYAHPFVLAAVEGARLGLRETRPAAVAYGAGVILFLRASATARLPETLACAGPSAAAATPGPALAAWAAAEPRRAQAGSGEQAADWINLALIGNRAALDHAFAAAGWDTADRASARADVRTFLAVAEDHGYDHGPVSLLTLDGAAPAVVFQRQTNTFAKRHHVRVWPAAAASPDGTAWLGAATHDIGLEFSHTTKHYTHRIDGHLDDERHSLLVDLVMAGVVARYGFVPRPDVPAQSVNATGDAMATDGRLAVIWLRPAPDGR